MHRLRDRHGLVSLRLLFRVQIATGARRFDDATAFFLPYTWSLAVDLTIDLRWEHEEIVLFPTMPYFESWKEQDELLETDEAQAVETHGLPPI